jgi:hypothetical protein
VQVRGRGYEIRRASWQASNISTGEAHVFIFKNNPKEPFLSKKSFQSLRKIVLSKISRFLPLLFPKTPSNTIFMGGALYFVGEVM